jgi:hypothetical protein
MTRQDLNEWYDPDAIAEGLPVPIELVKKLWSLVPQEVKVPGENDVPEDGATRFDPYPWAEKLTDDEFAIVVKAIEDYVAVFDERLLELLQNDLNENYRA